MLANFETWETAPHEHLLCAVCGLRAQLHSG